MEFGLLQRTMEYYLFRESLGLTYRQCLILGVAEASGVASINGRYAEALDALRLIDPDDTGVWIRELGPALEQLRKNYYKLPDECDFALDLVVPMEAVCEGVPYSLSLQSWDEGGWDAYSYCEEEEVRLDGESLECCEAISLAALLAEAEALTPVCNWLSEGF